MKKKSKVFLILFIILSIVILFFNSLINFIVNVKWFKEVGYLSVFFTKMLAIMKLMIPIFIISFLVIMLYYKSIIKSLQENNIVINLNSSRSIKTIFTFINLLVSFFIAFVFSDKYWYRILQFFNSVDFNISDPIFNKDVSFYIFKLPLIQSLTSIITSILIFLILVTIVMYFIVASKDLITSNNASQEKGKGFSKFKSGLTKFAGKQLAIIAALILIMVSVNYLISSWLLVYSPRGVAFGASYTDVKVSLLFYKIISIVSIISAIIIFLSVLKSKVKPIIISIIAIVILVFAEGVSSSLVQRFVVKPNEKTLEQPYLKHSIDYTRKAFNIDNIEQVDFEVKNELNNDVIKDNKEIIDNIRINSFNPALEFYNQVQMIRYYYNFNDIDIDRYSIKGKNNQVFVAPREVDTSLIKPDTWQNRHLTYTHGYGVVMSKVNSVSSEGQPDFIIKDIPPENSTGIKLDNPRIYFGEKTNDYAVVNTTIGEFDYPKGGENQMNFYDGDAGVKLNIMNKLVFATYYKNINFLVSNAINSSSKILINRNIIDRVNKIAPFLTYDSDPYTVINNGRLVWVIDAYTTSDRYPYSQPYNDINYMRNSIKVTVDAYNGDVNFYIVDKSDPIAQSYSKIFKHLFKDIDELDKGIKDHFRYPQDIFNIQCNVLQKFHMTNPEVAYSGEDLWDISKNYQNINDSNKENTVTEGCYVMMKPPGEEDTEMMLLEYFTMKGKDNMVAMFGARMDDDDYGKLILYKFPTQKTIYSPYMFHLRMNQDAVISQQIKLWKSSDSGLIYGDIIIVPLNNSLLYFEPLYLRASSQNSIPEMKKIVMGYNEKIIIADSIKEGLNKLFDMNDKNSVPNESVTEEKGTNKYLNKIKEASDALNKAIEYQKNGDWAKYGEYIKKVEDILKTK